MPIPRLVVLALSVIVFAALAVGVSACGDDDESSGGGGGESSASVDLSQFEESLEAAEEANPNQWEGPTEPVEPPKDFKVAGVSCFSQLEGCLTPIEGAQHAAEELGWEFEIYDGEADPTVHSKRIQQAIQNNADAIILAAVDGNAVKSAREEAEKAGIIVVSTTNGTAPGEQGFVLDTSPNITEMGNAVADWIAVDSEGEGVVAPFLDREFSTNVVFDAGIKERLKDCAGCTVKPTTDFVATDVGTKLGPNTVAYLQDNPDVEYFYSTYDPAMVDQVAAVQQAGLDVKSCSELGDAQNLSFIRNEQIQACDAAWDNEYEGYATIDQISRLATDQPLAVTEGVPERFKYGENIPWVLLDKENLPEGDETYRAPFDYVSEYRKLWGLE
ncbi:MAG TPA: substrate-binding domain-containing protein [Solirubrobacterales bacterium]|nr:substrate-binding domain-containing protein [Solirubrobacterales bacterium]